MSTKGIEMPNELELYPHNEKAYRKLLDMLSETRRACIIHPTGTGKAFIAFRLPLSRSSIMRRTQGIWLKTLNGDWR